jgi:hypothetical protein
MMTIQWCLWRAVAPLARCWGQLVMVWHLWRIVRARDALADLDQEALIRGELKLRK